MQTLNGRFQMIFLDLLVRFGLGKTLILYLGRERVTVLRTISFRAHVFFLISFLWSTKCSHVKRRQKSEYGAKRILYLIFDKFRAITDPEFV